MQDVNHSLQFKPHCPHLIHQHLQGHGHVVDEVFH